MIINVLREGQAIEKIESCQIIAHNIWEPSNHASSFQYSFCKIIWLVTLENTMLRVCLFLRSYVADFQEAASRVAI